MTERFDYFVLFGEMRTGSNYLEENINLFPGLKCYGEVFNPSFVGHHNTKELFGMDLKAREADPLKLIDKMVAGTDGLPGFRFFNDHDPRVLEACMANPRCAKMVLTRNPIDSYVSRKIAGETGQWRLTDMKHQKVAKIRFDAEEFAEFLTRIQGFQIALQRSLQVSGQTAFYIGYEDINELDVLNGMATFLQQPDQLDAMSDRLKRQNPSALDKKVENFEDMQAALAGLDTFNLARTPNFEPRRGPVVPTYLAAAQSPLLFQPIKAGPVTEVSDWLASLDSVDAADLHSGFNQKALRQWKRRNPGHRSFTVVSHPVLRAHRAFCTHILPTEGKDAYQGIRETLRTAYKVAMPKAKAELDPEAHRTAFLGFLKFLAGNLAGQTSIRVDAAWATQTAVLQGMGEFSQPDMVLRVEHLQDGLEQLSVQIGRADVPQFQTQPDAMLADIYDDEVEKAVQDVYQRDYMGFGYTRWSDGL